MKTLAMWSGGKDSSLAVWRYLQKDKIDFLLCMMHKGKSRAHGIDSKLIKAQEKCIGIEILTEEAGWEEYEDKLKEVFKKSGVKKAVFGDIYLEEHRSWIERVCNEAGIKAFFPLWGENTEKLAREVAENFEVYVIAVKKDLQDFLGRRFDEKFIDDALKRGIDPCGENGEFHTVVVDAPFFKQRLNFKFGEIFESEKYLHLRIITEI